MNILSYKPFAHTESMQDIKLQADNEYGKIMSQFSPVSPTVFELRCKFTNKHKICPQEYFVYNFVKTEGLGLHMK